MSRNESYVLVATLLFGCAGSQATGARSDAVAVLFPEYDAGTPVAPAVPVAPVASAVPVAPVTPVVIGCNAKRVKTRQADAAKVNPRAAKDQPRILGGHKSDLPWVVALTHDGKQATQFCGGSVIEDQWVLTAAHCKVSSTDRVIVGAPNLAAIPATAVFAVEEVLEHAEYDEATHDNDIALIKLAKRIPNAPKVALYPDADFPAGTKGTVAGWGTTAENGQPSSLLLEVDVPLVTNKECSDAYADDVPVTSHMLCAGAPGKDSCQGDSGGPIAVNGAGAWRQTGVVSFGIGCGRPAKYGVYTRVSEYREWIAACSK